MLGQSNSVAQFQMMFPTRVVTPEDKPAAYTSVEDPTVGFASQANGLVPERQRTLDGKIEVLKANQKFFEAWGDIAGKKPPADQPNLPQAPNGQKTPPMPTGPQGFVPGKVTDIPVQVRNEHVQVASLVNGKALVKMDKSGKLTGDKAVIQAFTAANETHHLFSGALGREFGYQGENKGRLSIQLNDSSAMMSGPHHKTGQAIISTPEANAAKDPDIISHESGHAVLDAHRPQYSRTNSFTRSTHEAFADGTAMLLSLKDKDVRADVLARREKGQSGNLASNLGEGIGAAVNGKLVGPEAKIPESERRTSIRDASQAPPGARETKNEQCHDASQRFSTGLYRSVLDVEAQLRKENPKLSADEALKQATDRVSSDFGRTLDFLPAGNTASQADLARAMIKANQVDGGGDLAGLYRKNFEASNIQVKQPYYDKRDERFQALAEKPQFNAPAGLKGSQDGQRVEVGPQTQGIAAADGWLAKNGEMLGVKGMKAQQVYHNDKGETWVRFSDGKNPTDEATKRAMQVGFDKSGRMIHADPRSYVPDEKTVPLFGTPAPPPTGKAPTGGQGQDQLPRDWGVF